MLKVRWGGGVSCRPQETPGWLAGVGTSDDCNRRLSGGPLGPCRVSRRLSGGWRAAVGWWCPAVPSGRYTAVRYPHLTVSSGLPVVPSGRSTAVRWWCPLVPSGRSTAMKWWFPLVPSGRSTAVRWWCTLVPSGRNTALRWWCPLVPSGRSTALRWWCPLVHGVSRTALRWWCPAVHSRPRCPVVPRRRSQDVMWWCLVAPSSWSIALRWCPANPGEGLAFSCMWSAFPWRRLSVSRWSSDVAVVCLAGLASYGNTGMCGSKNGVLFRRADG